MSYIKSLALSDILPYDAPMLARSMVVASLVVIGLVLYGSRYAADATTRKDFKLTVSCPDTLEIDNQNDEPLLNLSVVYHDKYFLHGDGLAGNRFNPKTREYVLDAHKTASGTPVGPPGEPPFTCAEKKPPLVIFFTLDGELRAYQELEKTVKHF